MRQRNWGQGWLLQRGSYVGPPPPARPSGLGPAWGPRLRVHESRYSSRRRLSVVGRRFLLPEQSHHSVPNSWCDGRLQASTGSSPSLESRATSDIPRTTSHPANAFKLASCRTACWNHHGTGSRLEPLTHRGGRQPPAASLSRSPGWRRRRAGRNSQVAAPQKAPAWGGAGVRSRSGIGQRGGRQEVGT
jgi:hypothetical protein